LGAGGIHSVLRDIWLVGPMVGREDAVGDLRLTVEEIADEGFAIGGEGESLADFAVSKDGILEIDAEVGEISAGALGDSEGRLLSENGDEIGNQGAEFEIGGAFAKFEGADDGVGDDEKGAEEAGSPDRGAK
jgi:hypothetical protein